jgi:choline transport protein
LPFAYCATAEEVEDASLVVPRCMWWSYVLNVILGILMLIVMLFGIGNLDDALNSTAPYLNLFRNTGSTGMALALSIILFLLILSGNITALATASRELWAFSRDRGFPFSQWISRVRYSILRLTHFTASLLDGSVESKLILIQDEP